MTDRSLRVFIASASEGLSIANGVRDALRVHADLEPKVWNEGTFKPSQTFIESLEAELSQSDSAVLTADGRRSVPRAVANAKCGATGQRPFRTWSYFLWDGSRP